MFLEEAEIFVFPQLSNRLWVPLNLLNLTKCAVSSEAKRPENETVYSPSSKVEVYKAWRCTYSLPTRLDIAVLISA
jgi:hypothetical protein